MNMRAVIVEDEPLARSTLRRLVNELDWLECVAEAEDGVAAVEVIDRLKPDLVFLDIHMPGLDGLEVLERTQHHPAVIFTTAHSGYALEAFELEAIDYLLKPFGRDRFLHAVERARRLGAPADASAAARARRALRTETPLTRLLVRQREGLVPVMIADVERLEAADDYVAVMTRGRRHLVYLTMTEFYRRLDPQKFVRVHRSHIVNLDFVGRIVPYGDARLQVEMRDGTKILASRPGSQLLRDLSV
jgi:two-component system, LytTR family, response regulator